MPSRVTGMSPNPNELLMAVYGTSMGESNEAVEGHTAHRARMSGVGYSRRYGEGQSMSALPSGSDIDMFSDSKRIVDLDTEVSDGAFDLRVSQK